MTKLTALIVAALAVSILVATIAQAGTTDPRKCSTNTGTDQTKHAYYCAKNAATAAVRTKMAATQRVARWYPGVYCSQNVSLLRWKCQTFDGGDHWAISVVYRATKAGWRQTVTVVKTA